MSFLCKIDILWSWAHMIKGKLASRNLGLIKYEDSLTCPGPHGSPPPPSSIWLLLSLEPGRLSTSSPLELTQSPLAVSWPCAPEIQAEQGRTSSFIINLQVASCPSCWTGDAGLTRSLTQKPGATGQRFCPSSGFLDPLILGEGGQGQHLSGPAVSMHSPCINLPITTWDKRLAQGHTEAKMDEWLNQTSRSDFAFPFHVSVCSLGDRERNVSARNDSKGSEGTWLRTDSREKMN